MKTAIIVLVALSSLGGVAHAQPIIVDANVARTTQVQTADLNLSATAGHATAVRRIRSAAAEVCANDGDLSIASRLTARGCFRRAVDNGLRQLEVVTASLPSTEVRGF